MATGADQDLSLGKLRRAIDPGSVSSDTTGDSTLAANAAGATSDNANYQMSDFSISAVDAALSKSKFHDEGTAETIKMEFTDAGSRFITRIARHHENFVWKTSTSNYNSASAQQPNYTGSFAAAAISNIITDTGAGMAHSMSAAHAGDYRVSMSAAYVDDRQSAGFNDQATNYNKYIIGITQVEDTYNSVAITCFTPETKLTLVDGTTAEIQDLSIGDELLSMRMPNAKTEEEHPIIASEVAYADYCITDLGETEVVSAEIINMFFDFTDSYFVINGDIKATGEHPFFIKIPEGFYLETKGQNSEEFWAWEYVRNLKIGQIMYDKDMNEVPIETIEEVEEEIEIVNIDVDGNNTYFAEGILVHNKGSSSRPVANAAHTFEENPGVGATAI
jgi:hypothetical protein